LKHAPIDLLSSCASFEWRGPRSASLIEVNGSQLHVRRASTDWSAIVGNRPVIDQRTNNLADLFPSAAAMMRSFMDSVQSRSNQQATVTQIRAPKLG